MIKFNEVQSFIAHQIAFSLSRNQISYSTDDTDGIGNLVDLSIHETVPIMVTDSNVVLFIKDELITLSTVDFYKVEII